MSAWFSSHFAALRDALQRLLAAPINTLLSLLAIGIALALPAGALVVIDNLQTLGNGLAGRHEISIFLAADASRADAAEIDRRLKAGVSGAIRFVPREMALKQLQATEGLADVLSGLQQNPLPDAFVIRPTGPMAGENANLDSLAKTFAAWPKVAHVQVDSSWVRRLDALLRFGRLAATMLAVILGAGMLAVVFNTIRLQALGRRDEVELALLIGATPAFVARPFLWFGILEGIFGALVALALVSASMALLAAPAAELLALYGGSFNLRLLTPETAAGVLAAGGLLGWMAGWLTTRSFGRG